MGHARDLKEQLGERAKNIILDGLGLTPNRAGKILCPLHSEKTPSMSWFSDGLMWRCHACQGHIDIYSYYCDFENMEFREAVDKVRELTGNVKVVRTKPKEYTIPNIDTRPLSQPFIDYMSQRKIKKETLDHWGVLEATWNNKDVYVFSYLNDEGLIYVSYRGLGKRGIKGGCEPNTKPILWGMWNVDKSRPLVITEGQIDSMCVWQSGYKNVVSVPSGANNLTWIEHCWDWLQDIPEIIVFADNDNPGLEMAENVKRRLKNVKVLTHPKYKDPNEVLYFEGEKALREMIEEKISEMPQGLIDMADMEYKSAIGVQEDTIETGFKEYDAHVEDWKLGELTVVFGRNGEGKTTYISQVIAHCLDQDTKTFLYSGEMSNQKIQDWLYKQLIGNQNQFYQKVITKYRDKLEPKPEVIKKIKNWQRGKLFLFDRSEQEILGDIDKFFKTMEMASSRYGVKLFVIDNLMAILEENADSLYSDQANFVQRCKDFAVNNNVHIVLLAHPNKEKGEIKKADVGNLEKTDISGSNNIANKADNIISVERNWADDREYDAIITSLKDRETGQRKVMLFYFSKKTLRFYNDETPEFRLYGWQESKEEGFYDAGQIETPF